MTQPISAVSKAKVAQPQPLEVSRTFPARRETVFAAWSTAEHVRNWFSPQTYSVAACSRSACSPHPGKGTGPAVISSKWCRTTGW